MKPCCREEMRVATKNSSGRRESDRIWMATSEEEGFSRQRRGAARVKAAGCYRGGGIGSAKGPDLGRRRQRVDLRKRRAESSRDVCSNKGSQEG